MNSIKKIGFIGNPAILPHGSKDNTGNIVHGYAARSFFKDWVKVGTNITDENIQKVRENVSHLGFVAATMLHVNRTPKYIHSHENVAKFIEKLDLPVTTFGFGCQAELDQTIADAKVDERSVRLLRAISDHATSIAVRGEFTADLCIKYGVKNVEVIGCQSAYFGGMKNWANKDDFLNLSKKECEKSAAYLSLGPDERKLLEIALESHSDLIGQGDPTEEKIASGELAFSDYIRDDDSNWEPPYLKKMFNDGTLQREFYYNYVKKNFYKFYNVEDWLKHFSGNYDFCYGTRFHGNMIAFWAGIPSLWIAHDMRTLELCEQLKLPYIKHQEINNISHVDQLFEKCDYSDYWRSFPSALKSFRNYLEENDVAQFLSNSGVGKVAL